ncbi:MAG: hypothetical protein PUE10_06135 [Bacteroidales bacterium]|nr:hypothetical protein [Bacteroidales bacterium]
MRKLIFIFAFLCSCLVAQAHEYVAAWKIVGLLMDNEEETRKVPNDALNLLWIEVEGDNIILSSSYNDVKDIKIGNLDFKGGHGDEKDLIFTADLLNESGEIMISILNKGANPIISFMNSPRKYSILNFDTGPEITYNRLLYLIIANNEKVSRRRTGTLEKIYLEVKNELEDHKKDKSNSTTSQSNRNSTSNQTPKSSSASSTVTTEEPKYGEIKLNGYFWKWDDYYGKSRENENGYLRLKTSERNHYTEVAHSINVTNLTDDDKSKTKWSTRYGAIKVNLPKGVKINSTDEVICWEKNAPFSSNPNYRVQVLFAWNSSTNQLQCIRNTRRSWAGRTLNDVYYFRTIDASAWKKIKSMLLHQLPYIATQVY